MPHPVIKLIVVGDTNVGKTSLVNRYVDETFTDTPGNTVGVDFFNCKIELYGQTHIVQLWDTAGQERFKSVVKCYFKSASGVLIVFDISQRSTFDHVSNWLEDMEDNVGENVIKVLVGSKADLTQSRAVSVEEAREFAETKKMQYFETSAKSALGINILFESVVKMILESGTPNQNQTDSSQVQTLRQPSIAVRETKSKKCCDF